VGTPYDATDDASVAASLQAQGREIVGRLSAAGITAEWDDEIVAMIAYLQRLGVEGRAQLDGGGE
jgi:cbb3-type cytochrome oxidase cytochrome c subunit